MSESKEQKRLRALQGDIDRAATRLEACRTRREHLTRARESAFAAENLAATHRHIEKLKALFGEERAAYQAYTNAIDALSRALEEIEHRAPARRRRR